MREAPHISRPDQFTTFGSLLRYLRERVELTQRELAHDVGYHHSYISRLEKNERSPDRATLAALFVPALGLDDEPQWTERLIELAGGNAKRLPTPGIPTAPPAGPRPESPNRLLASLLPISLTPLIGRQKEVERLTQLLLGSEARLITLVGPPGVGKTRLALHTAHQMQSHFAHGVSFIDLTRVAQARGVLPAFADALGLADVSESQLKTHFVNFLQQKHMLLVVDNFEHVLDASPELVLVLGNSPQVKALVTSREALRVPGEHEFAVEPLPLPPAADGALAEFPAVQLFIQRAQAVKPDFQLTADNREAVAELCRRLDGLPLALELAAPRIKVLPPQAMLKQFARRLDWTARREHAASPTLRGALEWSHNLFSEKAQTCFRRLSVFSGGWGIEAAEAVCADPDSLDAPHRIDRSAVFDLLMQLSDKSMVVVDPRGEEPCFRFLETLHDFAREKLARSHEPELVRNKHLAYFAACAEQAEAHLLRGERAPWICVGEEEQSNFEAALQWGLQPGAFLSDGLRLIAAVSLLWSFRSRFRVGFEYAKSYLQHPRLPEHRALQAKILFRAGAIAIERDDHLTAYTLCKQSLEIYRTLDDAPNLARALYHFGEACYQLDKLAEARAALEECERLCRENDDPVQLGLMLALFGMVRYYEGNFGSARAALQEALALATHVNDPWGLSNAYFYLGVIDRYTARYDEAIECFLHSLGLFSDLGDRNFMGHACIHLSITYNLTHRYAESGDYAERTLAIFQSLGDDVQIPFPLRMMGYAAIHAGNLARAHELMRESLRGNFALADLCGQLACLVGAACCALAEANPGRAVELCALADMHREQHGFQFLAPDALATQEILPQCERQLGQAAYAAAQQAGQNLSLDDTLAQLMAG